MKAVPFHIPKSSPATIHLQRDRGSEFYPFLHTHSEIQITRILLGRGTLICGSHVGTFREEDIFVMGPHVPHLFKSDESLSEMHSISVFAESEFILDTLFSQGDRLKGEQFIQQTKSGLKIKNSSKVQAGNLLEAIQNTDGIEKFTIFVQLIELLLNEKNFTSLSDSPVITLKKDYDGDRLNRIIQWLSDNFQREVSLEEASERISLTRTAFCRYFRQRTGKTFTEYLNSLRINHACRMLIGGSETVREIAWKSGFNNLSQFNRKFRELKKMTPLQYRKNATE